MKTTVRQKHPLAEEKTEKIATIFFTLAVRDRTREEQLKLISEAIVVGCNNYDQESIGLLPIIKKNLENSPSSYRRYLREIYLKLPGKHNVDGTETEIAPKLKLAILKEILEGWRWWRNDSKNFRIEPDTETCLVFVCDSYVAASAKLKSKIIDLFHEYFQNRGTYDPIPWIGKEYLPMEIMTALIQIRTKIYPLFALQEIKLSEAFDLHSRSADVVQIGKNYLVALKRIEDITIALAEKIRSMEKGIVFSEDIVFSEGREAFSGYKIKDESRLDVKHSITHASQARVEIIFKREPAEGYDKLARSFEIERANLLQGTVLLPASAIKIIVMNPDGTVMSPL